MPANTAAAVLAPLDRPSSNPLRSCRTLLRDVTA
jgi:hypothetical protein